VSFDLSLGRGTAFQWMGTPAARTGEALKPVVGRPEGPYCWPFTARAEVVSMSRFRGALLTAATLGLVLTTGCGGLSNGPLDRAAGGTSASVTTVPGSVTTVPGTETATDPRTEGSVTSTSGRVQTQQVVLPPSSRR
jgi:hypothetical protein